MDKGWIKIHRKIWENPVVTKDPDYFTVWIYLLTHANHRPRDMIFGTARITVNAGQLITGRKKIAQITRVSESKVFRILKTLEIEQQIEQQVNSRGSLITILSWDRYQETEQQIEQQVNSNRTASEQQVNTNKNIRIKEFKNLRITKQKQKQKGEGPVDRRTTKDRLDAFRERRNETNERWRDKWEETK